MAGPAASAPAPTLAKEAARPCLSPSLPPPPDVEEPHTPASASVPPISHRPPRVPAVTSTAQTPRPPRTLALARAIKQESPLPLPDSPSAPPSSSSRPSPRPSHADHRIRDPGAVLRSASGSQHSRSHDVVLVPRRPRVVLAKSSHGRTTVLFLVATPSSSRTAAATSPRRTRDQHLNVPCSKPPTPRAKPPLHRELLVHDVVLPTTTLCSELHPATSSLALAHSSPPSPSVVSTRRPLRGRERALAPAHLHLGSPRSHDAACCPVEPGHSHGRSRERYQPSSAADTTTAPEYLSCYTKPPRCPTPPLQQQYHLTRSSLLSLARSPQLPPSPSLRVSRRPTQAAFVAVVVRLRPPPSSSERRSPRGKVHLRSRAVAAYVGKAGAHGSWRDGGHARQLEGGRAR
ncbi:proline-rich protein 36-like [Sorghum bicolor]|uniref:proline-rich protein 36-like n=1 Tax=Sorghum bicolor TaxID=4558 RepID=UPI000B425372|nr:proline-rich protein 36-like [Sorghum bicolor]|eukprot:XP_021305589.1 proline-rich protein 36-like [Sorghum bicolor]